MPTTVRMITSAFGANGTLLQAGQQYDLEDSLADRLVSENKAIRLGPSRFVPSVPVMWGNEEQTALAGPNDSLYPVPGGGIRAASDFNRLTLLSGGAYLVPAGAWSLQDIGPYIQLQQWDAQRLVWRNRQLQRGGTYQFTSNGASHRVVNTGNCLGGVTAIVGGSGYSASNPPTITVGIGNPPGKLRCTVGGAVTMLVDAGGLYSHQPTIEWDVSQQTPPFRTPQFCVNRDESGVITSCTATGNDQITAQSGLWTEIWTGAGLDVHKLSCRVVRHPDDIYPDTGSNVAQLRPVAAAAGKVTAVEIIDYGGAVGNIGFGGGFFGNFTINHNGGSGFTCALAGNFFVSSMVIVSGGTFPYATGDIVPTGGAYGYPQLICSSGVLDAEISTPHIATGFGTVTNNGVKNTLTSVQLDVDGICYQTRPVVNVLMPSAAQPSETPVVFPIFAEGNDYATLVRLA